MCSLFSVKALPPNCHFWIGGSKHKTEIMLKELQKHFRREWFASMQDLTLVNCSSQYLGCLGQGGGIIEGLGGATDKGLQSLRSK
jgi:hypothetical protein